MEALGARALRWRCESGRREAVLASRLWQWETVLARGERERVLSGGHGRCGATRESDGRLPRQGRRREAMHRVGRRGRWDVESGAGAARRWARSGSHRHRRAWHRTKHGCAGIDRCLWCLASRHIDAPDISTRPATLARRLLDFGDSFVLFTCGHCDGLASNFDCPSSAYPDTSDHANKANDEFPERSGLL